MCACDNVNNWKDHFLWTYRIIVDWLMNEWMSGKSFNVFHSFIHLVVCPMWIKHFFTILDNYSIIFFWNKHPHNYIHQVFSSGSMIKMIFLFFWILTYYRDTVEKLLLVMAIYELSSNWLTDWPLSMIRRNGWFFFHLFMSR